ncbi:thiamine biosynthesis protein ThiF [Opitutaceae bacterium EW11]|nr:thiamine biosynthesis protein ThiF [Opitutaceae bacterium EW11]
MNLTPGEIARYQRHLSLAGFGAEAQMKLKNARVLVIGAGGLGSPALLYLAAAGVGRIVIIDPDRVEVSNLQRQVLYTEADAGLPKVEAAARRLRAMNPFVEVVTHAERFTRNNALALLADVDVVIDGSDNFATRYLVNDACVLTNRPLVYGAIHGFEGQVSVFNWRGGPTYRCLFAEPPEAGAVPNCAEAGVLGVLPGLVGTMQACETIKLITGIGEPLSGRLWLWNALTMTSETLKLVADPKSREIRELPPEGYGAVCAVEAPVPETDVLALREAMENVGRKRPQLVDVRESWEREQGAILPSLHVPLGELESGDATSALRGLDPAGETIVYCASGRRSLRGASLLRERYGFHAAVSLHGGYKAWAASAAPIES